MSQKDSVLVIGASGQIGSELVLKLREIYGNQNVIAADVKTPNKEIAENGPFEYLNTLDKIRIEELVLKYQITQIYQLAALLSATAEKNPSFAWDLNMNSLFHVLEIAKEKTHIKVFWPSSIAVFGPNTPKEKTPQLTTTDPSTVYGISKLAGELWCDYYHRKFQVDVRSVRYPGLISYKSPPGGGTTDYAIHIFHEAKKHKKYTSFLNENSTLPMMFMDDAIRATIEIMNAPSEKIKIRTSYNIAGVSFNPKELAQEIKKHIPEFEIQYQPDFRQEIADSWPKSIDDSLAKTHWNWQVQTNVEKLVDIMLKNI
jgi:nucleoside-diphosphate-sugar epimerase